MGNKINSFLTFLRKYILLKKLDFQEAFEGLQQNFEK